MCDQKSTNPLAEQLQEATLRYYETHAEVVAERTQSPDRAEMCQPFIHLLPAHAHILDAGCGAGYDSLYFIQQGFVVTAFDASVSLAQIASQRTHQPVWHLRFEEIAFDNQFDGIWACASLLHVPRLHMPDVLTLLVTAMKTDGVLYASFMYGDVETVRGDCFFNDYTEQGFREVAAVQPRLKIIRCWKTGDLPPMRPGREWLHVLAKKVI
jgi:2-polyprenyl-3-methyl-5-hydroxy-6-metoxy-1,4-benzoquinol methylase